MGEEDSLDVGRFMVDRQGELPVLCNEPLGSQVLSLLSGSRAKWLFPHIMAGVCWIRSFQANHLRVGGWRVDLMDKAAALPTSQQAQREQGKLIDRILAA